MNHNSSIKCVVNECKHHCKEDQYCTLDSIMVSKHGHEAKTIECTDCNSFELK